MAKPERPTFRLPSSSHPSAAGIARARAILRTMEFRFLEDAPDRAVISVDGVLPVGPNFSHWPGNRTPRDLVADTSTGIAMRLAELDSAERARRLEGETIVANNHFDTDGVLSCFAVMHPGFALANRGAFLDAATTGDFQVHTTDAALALDLAIDRLGSNAGPHGDELRGLDGAARGQRQYELAFAVLESWIADPGIAARTVENEMRGELGDLAEARGHARVETIASRSLAIVTHRRELKRLAVNTLAGARVRVLHAVPVANGTLFRLHERVESWFEMATLARIRRLDLRAIAARLNSLEPRREDAACWIAHDPRSPVPELFFGVPGGGRAIAGNVSGELAPSRLDPKTVLETVAEGIPH